eukprot:633275_1
MAKLSEDEIRIALVNLSSHNIELESLECSQKKFPNVKWRMWKQSYSKNSKSRYHDGYVCAKSDDPAYAQTNGWISRKCTRKYDQRANRSHFTRNKTHWKLHTDAKVGLRKVSKFHYVTSNDDRNICVFGEERIKRKEQKSLRLMMHQQKAKCEEKAPILDHTIDTQTVLSDEDVLRDPLDTIDTIDTISGKKRTLHEFINSEMNHNQTTHERPNKKRKQEQINQQMQQQINQLKLTLIELNKAKEMKEMEDIEVIEPGVDECLYRSFRQSTLSDLNLDSFIGMSLMPLLEQLSDTRIVAYVQTITDDLIAGISIYCYVCRKYTLCTKQSKKRFCCREHGYFVPNTDVRSMHAVSMLLQTLEAHRLEMHHKHNEAEWVRHDTMNRIETRTQVLDILPAIRSQTAKNHYEHKVTVDLLKHTKHQDDITINKKNMSLSRVDQVRTLFATALIYNFKEHIHNFIEHYVFITVQSDTYSFAVLKGEMPVIVIRENAVNRGYCIGYPQFEYSVQNTVASDKSKIGFVLVALERFGCVPSPITAHQMDGDENVIIVSMFSGDSKYKNALHLLNVNLLQKYGPARQIPVDLAENCIDDCHVIETGMKHTKSKSAYACLRLVLSVLRSVIGVLRYPKGSMIKSALNANQHMKGVICRTAPDQRYATHLLIMITPFVLYYKQMIILLTSIRAEKIDAIRSCQFVVYVVSMFEFLNAVIKNLLLQYQKTQDYRGIVAFNLIKAYEISVGMIQTLRTIVFASKYHILTMDLNVINDLVAVINDKHLKVMSEMINELIFHGKFKDKTVFFAEEVINIKKRRYKQRRVHVQEEECALNEQEQDDPTEVQERKEDPPNILPSISRPIVSLHSDELSRVRSLAPMPLPLVTQCASLEQHTRAVLTLNAVIKMMLFVKDFHDEYFTKLIGYNSSAFKSSSDYIWAKCLYFPQFVFEAMNLAIDNMDGINDLVTKGNEAMCGYYRSLRSKCESNISNEPLKRLFMLSDLQFKSALCRFKKWIISYVLGNNPLRRLQKSQYTAAYSRGDHKEYQPILIAIERIAMESLIIVNNFVQFKTFWDFEQSKKRSSSAWCEPLGSKINKICKKPSGRTPGPQLVDEALIIQTHCDWSQGSINIIASSIANALVDSNKGIRSSGAKHNIKRRKKTMVKGTNRQTNYINRLQHGKETQYCLKYSVKISALRPILSEVALNKKPKQIDWQNTADVDALFAVIDNTEEIYHDIIDKQYIERAAKSIVQPLQTLLKDNPTISARQAKQLIGIDDLPRKTKKLVWKKAWSMINDKDK